MLVHRVLQLDQGQVASAWLEVDVDDAHSELTDLVLLPVQVAEANVAVVDADADVVELDHTVLRGRDKVLRDEGASTELRPCKDIIIFIKTFLTIIINQPSSDLVPRKTPHLNPADKGQLSGISNDVSVNDLLFCKGRLSLRSFKTSASAQLRLFLLRPQSSVQTCYSNKQSNNISSKKVFLKFQQFSFERPYEVREKSGYSTVRSGQPPRPLP